MLRHMIVKATASMNNAERMLLISKLLENTKDFSAIIPGVTVTASGDNLTSTIVEKTAEHTIIRAGSLYYKLHEDVDSGQAYLSSSVDNVNYATLIKLADDSQLTLRISDTYAAIGYSPIVGSSIVVAYDSSMFVINISTTNTSVVNKVNLYNSAYPAGIDCDLVTNYGPTDVITPYINDGTVRKPVFSYRLFNHDNMVTYQVSNLSNSYLVGYSADDTVTGKFSDKGTDYQSVCNFLFLAGVAGNIIREYVLSQELNCALGVVINYGFGRHIAISEDGSTLVTTISGGSTATGYAQVFVHNGTSWVYQALLNGSVGKTNEFGMWSVAISSNGDRIIVGDPRGKVGSTSQAGTAYVFTRTSGKWSSGFRIENAASFSGVGKSVSVSGDGNTVVVSAYSIAQSKPVIMLYKNSGSNWVHLTNLSAETYINYSDFGSCVAISSDGNTVVAGASYDNGFLPSYTQGTGFISIFRRIGTSNSFTRTTIKPTGQFSKQYFAKNCAISADGNTIVVGAPAQSILSSGASTLKGSVYVYRFDGSAWNESRIQPSDSKAGDAFGNAVSVTPDGNTVAVGSRPLSQYYYVFDLVGTEWKQKTRIHFSAATSFALAVAISPDSNTLVIGSSAARKNDIASAGRVVVYTM